MKAFQKRKLKIMKLTPFIEESEEPEKEEKDQEEHKEKEPSQTPSMMKFL